jgi:phytoene synthase
VLLEGRDETGTPTVPAGSAERAVIARARVTTRRHARTFSAACLLLPRRLRDDVRLLYLVLRTLDDLVDEGDPAANARLGAVEAWCEGRGPDPATPETAVLDVLAARHPLPRNVLRDFCAGMRTDLDGTPPRTEAELDRYCYRVAGTVGVLMCALLGVRGDEDVAHRDAVALGVAMQRTNILRDIDEDRRAGRRYLSDETVARFGPGLPGSREALLRDQIARADHSYAAGIAGIRRLRHGRAAIRVAAAMYREILREIERSGFGRCSGRVVVGRPRKAAVAARALAAGASRR